jgi:hypothetical protein
MFPDLRLLLLRCTPQDRLQPLQYHVLHLLRLLRGLLPLQLRLRLDLDPLLLSPLHTKLQAQPLDLLHRLLDPLPLLSHVYLDHLSIDSQ